MGLEFFRKSIEIERKYKRPGTTILNTIQTNGVLLDDEWCAFFKDQRLSGRAESGRPARAARRLSRGQGRSTDVRQGDARSTAFAETRRRVQRAHHGAREKRRQTAAGLSLSARRGGGALHPVHPDRRTQECDRLPGRQHGDRPFGDRGAVRAVLDRDFRRVGEARRGSRLRTDVRRRAGRVGRRAAPHCACSLPRAATRWRSSTTAISIHATISSNPNTSWATSGICRWSIWSLRNSSAASVKPNSTALPKYCRECKVRFACHGGCPKDRFIKTPDGEANLNYLCAGYKAFFLHVDRPMRQMAALLQLGRAPADVMFSQAGRNDPCPCAAAESSSNATAGRFRSELAEDSGVMRRRGGSARCAGRFGSPDRGSVHRARSPASPQSGVLRSASAP